LRGDVRLSTFKYIGECDMSRADPDEGTEKYKVNFFDSSKNDTCSAKINDNLSNRGIHIGGKNVLFYDNTVISRHPNSYVLCTSLKRNSDYMRSSFGEVCIEIKEPECFLYLVAQELNKKSRLNHATIGMVQYCGRSFQDAENGVDNIAFANVEGNRREQEVRMIWCPLDQDSIIEGATVNVPEVAELCSIL